MILIGSGRRAWLSYGVHMSLVAARMQQIQCRPAPRRVHTSAAGRYLGAGAPSVWPTTCPTSPEALTTHACRQTHASWGRELLAGTRGVHWARDARETCTTPPISPKTLYTANPVISTHHSARLCTRPGRKHPVRALSSVTGESGGLGQHPVPHEARAAHLAARTGGARTSVVVPRKSRGGGAVLPLVAVGSTPPPRCRQYIARSMSSVLI
mmetsp:Transcript_10229/g.22189  ORF Transcript_10229/g.22189 Transcript_10229/m.22189 type:complete len:211 (+) Transcript_10229:196-828(+)